MSVKLPETERFLEMYCRRWWRRSRKKRLSESTREIALDRRGTSANGGYDGEGDLVPLCARVIENLFRNEKKKKGSFLFITLFGWRRRRIRKKEKKSYRWRRFYTCQWYFLGATSSGRKYLEVMWARYFFGGIGACNSTTVFSYAEIITWIWLLLADSVARWLRLRYRVVNPISIFTLFLIFGYPNYGWKKYINIINTL